MYKIRVISHFGAAHFLKGYKGKCESLHGHNWKVEVIVSGNKLDSLGMVMDFSQLKKLVNGSIVSLDHKSLNDIDYFQKHNPSSEEIAKYIFHKLQPKILEKNCILEEVQVWETENSCAIYQLSLIHI